ncbi:hypothetical protein PVAND_004049 [Polypedilum vanderplanki]|uniref:Glucose-methanol-choline oxidoreductase C-terminal domain-containing protein n=1 Tax=Polypedilum vanderplanki TaxID=319348 RepID=A0A9J6BX18_POLVA|nr:hypothetical protein PVAND_004049 [Polypedilum vanderplanki]
MIHISLFLSSINIQGFINVNSTTAPYPDVQLMTILYDQFQVDFNIILNDRFGAQPFIPPIAECAILTYCSDAYLACYLKYMTLNLWHPTGTCKMGQSPIDSVVDSNLRVFGVKRGLGTTRTN